VLPQLVSLYQDRILLFHHFDWDDPDVTEQERALAISMRLRPPAASFSVGDDHERAVARTSGGGVHDTAAAVVAGGYPVRDRGRKGFANQVDEELEGDEGEQRWDGSRRIEEAAIRHFHAHRTEVALVRRLGRSRDCLKRESQFALGNVLV